MQKPKINATIWTTFEHFDDFKNDPRLSGIRLNSAAIESAVGLKEAVESLKGQISVPYAVDFKGRQPRVLASSYWAKGLALTMNHSLSADLPTGVAFKAEKDFGMLVKFEDNGRRLLFEGSPIFKVGHGESIHIKDQNFRINITDTIFSIQEKEKIAAVLGLCDEYYLSYVEDQRDIDEFREIVGPNALIRAKIETRDGLRYVADRFKPQDNVQLVAARGDLYIEVLHHHEILEAMKLIISKDKNAMAASRIFLSIIGYKNPLATYMIDRQRAMIRFLEENYPEIIEEHGDKLLELSEDGVVKHFLEPNDVPECHDYEELAWLYDLGYRDFLLCDEICLEGKMLENALKAFHSFADYYPKVKSLEAFQAKLKQAEPKLGLLATIIKKLGF